MTAYEYTSLEEKIENEGSWCRRHKSRQHRPPPHKPIVFIVFQVPLSLCFLFSHQLCLLHKVRGFTLQKNQLFSVHTTLESFKPQQSSISVILEFSLRKPRSRKLLDFRDVIVFEKLRFKNVKCQISLAHCGRAKA